MSSSLLTNLVAYWRMDEAAWTGAAGEVLDSSGNALHGTAGGGATTVAGKLARAGEFGGAGKKVVVGDNDLLDLTSAFTLAAWVKWTNRVQGDEQIFDKRIWVSSGNNSGFRLQNAWTALTDKKNLRVDLYNNGTYVVLYDWDANMGTGAWHFVCGTYDAATVRLYVGGVQVGTPISYAGGAGVNTRDMDLGSGLGGMVDEAALWSRALSATEISQLYNEGRGLILPVASELTGRSRSRIAFRGGIG